MNTRVDLSAAGLALAEHARLVTLALAGHQACSRNGPALWPSNEDSLQRCAAAAQPVMP